MKLSPTQRAVIEFLRRHKEMMLVVYADGRVDWSPWWSNPKFYPNGNPPCTRRTFRALFQRGAITCIQTIYDHDPDDYRILTIVEQHYRPSPQEQQP
jgi:hypothetical protein